MKRLHSCVGIGLFGASLLGVVLPSMAQSGPGLNWSSAEQQWPRWQARVGLQAGRPLADPDGTASNLRGMRLLGDYYLTGPGFGQGQVTGGFRATSGLLLGPRGSAWGIGAASSGPISVGLSRDLDTEGDRDSLPYLGIGYTGLSLRGGWGFSADLGVMGSPDGSGLKVGRTLQSLGLDDRLRELRLAPVLQIGLRYAF